MALLYQAYQNHMDLTEPWRQGAAAALRYLNLIPSGLSSRAMRRPPAPPMASTASWSAIARWPSRKK